MIRRFEFLAAVQPDTPYNRLNVRQCNIGRHRLVETQTSSFSVFCQEAQPFSNGLAWPGRPKTLTFNMNLAAIRWVRTKDSLHQFCSARAGQSCDSNNFACTSSEARIDKDAFHPLLWRYLRRGRYVRSQGHARYFKADLRTDVYMFDLTPEDLG